MRKNVLIHEGASFSQVSGIKNKNNIVEFVAVLQSNIDKQNRNGRVYPRAVLEEALRNPMLQDRMRRKTLYGEAGHPKSQELSRQMDYDHSNLAVIIKEVWWEGNNLMGKCETTDTVLGRDMKGLIEQGSEVAFSLRAQGSVHQDRNGQTIVESPLKIFTWDWVVIPSHDESFIQSICNETFNGMYRMDSYGNKEMALSEATVLYESGSIMELSEENMTVTQKDYTKYFGNGLRPLSETYIFNEADVVKTTDGKHLTLFNESSREEKKVFLEEYVSDDIRNTIVTITNESKVK